MLIDTAYSDSDEAYVATPDSEKDEELLKEIREQYKAFDEYWADVRKERNTDLRYINGDPWAPEDRAARVNAGRPCINHDELNQYVNQCVNSVRQNKRGIKVDPRGERSNDRTALLTQDLVRTIEYDCNAPSIYAKAYQDMVEGSYSFFRISRQYASDNPNTYDPSIFDQEIVIKPIANPNSVLFDPFCKEPDWSDASACFVLEPMSKEEFKRRFPNAEIKNFSSELMNLAADWITAEQVVVGEYWRVKIESEWRYWLEDGRITDKPQCGVKVIDKRKINQRRITQYITNGLEILDRSPQPGTILPIIPMIGLERYIEVKASSKRMLYSLVRLARDPQLSLAYLNSQEMEEAGLSPKSPFIGYKGQFDSNRKMWETVTKQAWSHLEADIPDNWPAGQVPPLPSRVPFTPNFQQYELAKDSCRRAIQSAMGITPLPTAAQRQTEKSGIALQRIGDMEAIGSYHFIDGYDRAVRLAGRVIDQWIPVVYDRSARIKHLRKPDDSYRRLVLNTGGPYFDERTQQPVQYNVEEVDHAIAISTGPSIASQREAVDEFLTNLIVNLPNLPITPPQAQKLLSLAIQMKNLGPKGDEMAEIISPSQGSPDQSLQQLQQAQAVAQQQGILIQQLQAELQKLQVEKQAKVVEGEYKLLTEKMRTEASLLVERLKVDAQVATAEIQTKSQVLNERLKAFNEAQKQANEQVHEARSQVSEQEHEVAQSRRELLHQALETAAQRAHEAEQAEADRQNALDTAAQTESSGEEA